MFTKLSYQLYKFGEFAYRKAYGLYQPIYFYWKARKDSKKIVFLKEYVKPGMTVVDVGANVGFYSALFSKWVGENGKVHAFEPDKDNFKHLVSNTGKRKNVTTNNVAVSDKSGKIRFYHSLNLNVEHQTYDSGEGRSFTEIDCVSLNDYFKNGESVQLLKTDTEGYDFFVIKGMTDIIKRSSHFVAVIEFWPYGLNNAGTPPATFISQLKELGFTLTFMDPKAEQNYEQMIKDKYYYTDVIAVK